MRARSIIATLLTVVVCIGMLGRISSALAQAPSPQHAPPPPEMRVDINHATIEELLKVPGMTRTWAGRIVRFRPYRTKQDLVDKGVLSGEAYNRIKDYVIAHRKDSDQ